MIYQVETLDDNGTVIHGFSVNAYDPDTARAFYMRQIERPQLKDGWRVVVHD